MARYRVTYNVLHFRSKVRPESKAQVTVEVEVKRGEQLKNVAYGYASDLLPEMRFSIEEPPASVEKLRPKRVRRCRCGAVMPDEGD